jgi:hypothetical protein
MPEAIVKVQDAIGHLVGATDEHHPAGLVAGSSVRRRSHGATDLG